MKIVLSMKTRLPEAISSSVKKGVLLRQKFLDLLLRKLQDAETGSDDVRPRAASAFPAKVEFQRLGGPAIIAAFLLLAVGKLVCSMNPALIEGVVEGLALPAARPVLAPAPGMCCVCLRLEAK